MSSGEEDVYDDTLESTLFSEEEEATMSGYNKPTFIDFENGNIKENWRKFKRDFNTYLYASDLHNKSDERKIALLLNLAGPRAADVFDTFKLTDDQKKVYATVLKTFEDYCNPKGNSIVERFHFNGRIQEEGEKFDQFYTALRTRALNCEFGDQEDSLIRDRIVFGIRDKDVQKELLRIPDLNLESALKLCRSAENSETHQQEINKNNGKSMVSDVLAIKTNKRSSCHKCGYQHEYGKCPAYGKTCTNCGMLNHFIKCCGKKHPSANMQQQQHQRKTATSQPTAKANALSAQDDNDVLVISVISSSVADIESSSRDSRSWFADIFINNTWLKFKLDSGAQINVLPKKYLAGLNIDLSSLKLCSVRVEVYGGKQINILGEIVLKCVVNDRDYNVKFIVPEIQDVPILGLNTCVQLNLIQRIDAVLFPSSKEELISKYKDLFEGVGKFARPYKLKLIPGSVPVQKSLVRIPQTVLPKLRKRLDEYLEAGFIAKVDEPTEWVSNIALPEKGKDDICLCLAPIELNKCLVRDIHPIPTQDEIAGKLLNKVIFTVADIKDAFMHMVFEEESSFLTTFITPFGKFRWLRVCFGISVAPEAFQGYMDEIFGELGARFIDDQIIGGKDEEEHDKLLEQFFELARKGNVRFNPSKLQYKVTHVKYLGATISAEGIQPDQQYINDILEMQPPTTQKELLSFIGVVNFLHKHIPYLAELMGPLRSLTKKDAVFLWTPDHSVTFEKILSTISNVCSLKILNPNLGIEIYADASMYGLGACIFQDGQPVYFASRTLTDTEKIYAQIEKEMLAICFAVERFHQFIYGCKDVKIYTDHKPLIGIMQKDLHKLTCRLQRMRLRLLRYPSVVYEYLPGKQNIIADLLSRNPSAKSRSDTSFMSNEIHAIRVDFSITPERKKLLQEETAKDEILKEVSNLFLKGWPQITRSLVHPDVKFYYNLRNNILLEDGLLYFNERLIVPSSCTQRLLELLHTAHQGVEKMKLRSRKTCYWRNISSDIEKFVNRCESCNHFRSSKVKEPFVCRQLPELSFEQVAVDIAQYSGKNYLILVDFRSNWIECKQISQPNTKMVIVALKEIFSIHGIPNELYADNVPFNSVELKNFAKEWNFSVITTSPRYSQANGKAEKAVGIVKQMLKKCDFNNSDFFEMLLEYRVTPQKCTGYSPAEILFNRVIRSKIPTSFNVLLPKIPENVSEKLEINQKKQAEIYDRTCGPTEKIFDTGEKVWVQINNKWFSGVIDKKADTPRSYFIKMSNGSYICRNSKFIRKSKAISFYAQDLYLSKPVSPVHNNSSSGNKDNCNANNICGRPQRNRQMSKYLSDYVLD